MLEYPNPAFLNEVKALAEVPKQHPEILALALRYTWLSQEHHNINELRPYLRPEVDAVVRGTAASLMLRRGNSQERAEANGYPAQNADPSPRTRTGNGMPGPGGCRLYGISEYLY